MNLHNETMNIQCDTNDECTYKYDQEHHHTSYKLGHRDARHAAAELSLKQQAKFEEALDLLWATVSPFDKQSAQTRHEAIIKFLEENK